MAEAAARHHRAIYDHELSGVKPRPAGARRDRDIADWGGDVELFTGIRGRRARLDDAGRRLCRGADEHRASRLGGYRAQTGAHGPAAARATPAASDGHEHPREGNAPASAAWLPAPAFARGRTPLGAGVAGRLPAPAGETGWVDDTARAPAPTGPRTATITGRPGWQPGSASSARRRRPPRTVHERVGARPDRIAGWAFVLGLLLILVAVATASAASV